MKKSVIDKPISITCVALIVAFVALVIVKPDATINAVNVIFDYATAIFGVPILWFVFIGLFVCLYLAFGKYGKIKLGDGKPEYSLFSYIAMMMCAALAATAVYYSFVEWSFYLAEPSFGLEPYSREAAEYALPYAFFHWGFAVQVVFVLLGVCMAYGFYVKKVPHLRVSAICGEMMGNYKYKKPLGKIIDALTILSIIGGTYLLLPNALEILCPCRNSPATSSSDDLMTLFWITRLAIETVLSRCTPDRIRIDIVRAKRAMLP